MNVFTREFRPAEKLMLAVLVLILLGLGYYYFVDIPVRDTIRGNEAEVTSLRTQLDSVQQRLAALQSVQNSLDELKDQGKLSWMGSYNNSKAEVAFLNEILADTMNYSVSFAEVTRAGDQIRRGFTLQYQTANYAAAREIMTRLLEGRNRCIVGDMRCGVNADGTVTIAAAATFYETMEGGVPDAALPRDSAAANY